MSLLIPKNRKPKFRVQLAIQDLTNVPLVSGLVHVRWHLQDSLRSEARGKTERSPILDHKVEWGYEITWTARMIIDKANILQNATIVFEVYQEMYGGKERHALGKLELNLAEYASGEEVISRRYLLQDSKVNSTLKLGIHMDQISGDRDYHVPELKKAQVFGGIAGLLSESKDLKKREDEMGYGPDRDEAADRVAIQLEQDIYRNSIVRRWQAQAGELDPSSVVDDIFNGSDGWVKPYDENDEHARQAHRRRRESDEQSLEHDYEQNSRRSRRRNSDTPSELENLWTPERQAFEADEMLRSLTWTIDPVQVQKHVGKSLEQRAKELMA